MPDSLNLVKNPRFVTGRQAPRAWRWIAGDDGFTWQWLPGLNGGGPCMEISAPAPGQRQTDRSRAAPAMRDVWSQQVRCVGNQYYRVEATVSVTEPKADQGDPDTGLVLSVQPRRGEETLDDRLETPALQADSGTIRAFYETPARATSIDLRIGLRQDGGRAIIHEVLVMPILDPDSTSHPAAVPPPPYAYPAPKHVQSIGVCGDVSEDRTLVRILRARYGNDAIRVLRPQTLEAGPGKAVRRGKCDAILIAGALPPGIRSVGALLALAERHLVVLSPQALAGLSRGAVEVRTIRQKDDPLYATVQESNFITRGFALRDCFPFAGQGVGGADPRVFVQPQFRSGRAFTGFCRKNGFITVLRSETDADATSGKPICLYKETPGGGVVVMDLDPIESKASTANERSLAVFLLLNALGAEQTSLGQFAVPARSHREFWEQITDFDQRFAEWTVDGVTPPYRQNMRPYVQLGRKADASADTFGPPEVERPLILIRTGLTGDDLDGVYGAMTWLKSLVYPVPYACPYVKMLTSRYRIAWVPLCAEWPKGTGWRRPGPAVPASCGGVEPGPVAMVIDLTNGPRNELRVLMQGKSPLRRRIEQALLGLWWACFAGRYFGWSPADGSPMTDQRHYVWQMDTLVPRIESDDRVFADDFYSSARAAGADLVRVETPNSPADLLCNSIWRTDRVATLLEILVGLQCGLLAMNRRQSGLELPLPVGVAAPGDALHIVKAKQTPGQVNASPVPASRTRTVTLHAGEALCYCRS
ncbi:MAG: hypothetical protein JSV19_05820 [Phycisphaerales bacterium]|nr:MAG: hypothetical protein JSV19_05820 [Phycisphaerales bacterium]